MATATNITSAPLPSRRGVLFYGSAIAAGCAAGSVITSRMTAYQAAVARHAEAHDAMLAACKADPADEDGLVPFFDAETKALNHVAHAPCVNDAEFFEKLEYLLRREMTCQGGAPDESDPYAAVLIAVHNRMMPS